MKLTSPLLALLLASVSPAVAQSYRNPDDRLQRLEHDITLLQRQVSRTGGSSAPVGDGPASAQIEVRLSAIEEEQRALRGRIEESEFQSRKVAEDLAKMQKDVDFRLNELSAGGAPAASASAATAGTQPPAPVIDMANDPKIRKPKIDTEPPLKDGRKAFESAPDGPTTAGDGTLRLPEGDAQSNFSSPREHYNYAFRLLNQNQYEEAGKAFDSFTRKYPKDPLVGNAYYWEGESFYIKQDYASAADYFRQGFEALPEGPKAGDNLLKLGMSLGALGKGKEACIVLSQVVTKFKSSSTSVSGKAEQELKRIGCK